MNAAARRGMMALRVGSGPVVKGPELHPKMSDVLGLGNDWLPMIRLLVVGSMVPETVPAAAWVLMCR